MNFSGVGCAPGQGSLPEHLAPDRPQLHD